MSDVIPMEINTKRWEVGTIKGFSLNKLYPEALKISYEKYKDLQSLAHFVPRLFEKYFNDLPFNSKDKTMFEEFPDGITE